MDDVSKRITIPTEDALRRAQESAIAELDRQLLNNTKAYIASLFEQRHPIRNARGQIEWPTGPMWDLLKERVDTYVLSERFEERVQKRIEEVADEQADEAIRMMLKSASRRRVFGAVPYKKDDA